MQVLHFGLGRSRRLGCPCRQAAVSGPIHQPTARLLRVEARRTMPRSRRACPCDAVLHVVNRGNDRRTLFAADDDYRAFLGLTSWASAATGLRLLGYVVMPNHWHLVVWPASADQLSTFMLRLTGSHAAIVRERTSTRGAGHVYQGRYWARVITTELSYLRTLRYVEANPVRAKLVTRGEDWPWSSAHERANEHRLLSDGPVSLPPLSDWLEIVAVPLTTEQAATIRARRPRAGIAAVWPGEAGFGQ
jgi:putative transposase